MEVISSMFDYFSPIPTQHSIISEFDIDLHPSSALADNVPLEFNFNGADMIYIDLSQSELLLEIKILANAGAALAKDEPVGPANDILHTMWSSSDLYLNGQRVSDHNNHYGYRAVLEDLLHFTPEIQKTQLVLAGFAKDTAGKFDDAKAIGGTNNGLAQRAEPFRLGATVQLKGRPHHDLFHQHRAILPRTPIRIVFTPAANQFALMNTLMTSVTENPRYQIRIASAVLYLRAVHVAPSFSLSHETYLQKQNSRYPLIYTAMRVLTLPQGGTAFTNDVFQGVLPDRIFLVMVDHASMAGSWNTNPFNFQHFNVNYLALNVNGESVPRSPYRPNFKKHHFVREYDALFDTLGLKNSRDTINIEPNDFENGYAIFAFKINPDRQMSTIDAKTGSIRLDLGFDGATTSTINAILLCDYSTLLEIDHFRKVLLNVGL